MPLDWDQVTAKYASDPALTTVAGGRKLEVVAVDGEGLEIRSSLWTKTLARGHLEHAVQLIESGQMTPRWVDFVDQYGKLVTKERRSLAAAVLVDLGYLS